MQTIAFTVTVYETTHNGAEIARGALMMTLLANDTVWIRLLGSQNYVFLQGTADGIVSVQVKIKQTEVARYSLICFVIDLSSILRN